MNFIRRLTPTENVIIVIGGDDNYKDEDEEEKEFISRWARRKVSLQFSDEFMDGTESFIFSWDKKHRKIHEEALLHFFNPSRKGKKFEPQPPEHRAPTKSITQPQDTWDTLQCDSSFKERNTEGSYQSASYGLLPKESPGKAVRSSQDTADLSITTSSPSSQRAGRLGSEETTASFKINEHKGEVSFFCFANTSGE